MRLEHLEISGFKSFSDRSELAFDEGVTAIVGPNGCGKSNVADAITWVLGEQSAKSLRGDKMEDVIFNGSDARKPGATAEVRLKLSGLPLPPRAGEGQDDPGRGHVNVTFSEGVVTPGDVAFHGNGNGHHAGTAVLDSHAAQAVAEELARAFTRDVEVTRRLYRSGESEYLIDGEVCRLRDVHELLMDTGLGAKAYSIIEQGKIGMILSSRPADRRQLIEEAAGITKYKSRRRSAELKLEAAQQNLTRVDDIVFEVEKQRGTLKRQAGKARRYRTLREELRRWEKVLLARRYRELAADIEAARTSLAGARERETSAAARVAEVESDLSRLRIEQAEADASAARLREAAHAGEIEINRRQQQQEFDRRQAEALDGRMAQLGEEVVDLSARREPARIALESRRLAVAEALAARDQAGTVLTEATRASADAQQQIEGLETDLEQVRGTLYGVINSATAVRHVIEHAEAQRGRVGETLAKLAVELDDVRVESEKVEAERGEASEALSRAHAALDGLKVDRTACEVALGSARTELEWRARSVRTGEQEVAALEARLASLEEVATSRAEFGDAARMVLVQADGRVGQQGAVADFIEADSRYERAVEACLGDLLQHVVVERHEQAEAGLSLVREHQAGRCGFVVVGADANEPARGVLASLGLARPLTDVVQVVGPHALTIRRVLPEAYVADTFADAVEAARMTTAPVATLDGDVIRGRHLVSGGARAESRGILSTRREIKELRERVTVERQALQRLIDEVSNFERSIAESTSMIAALSAEQHLQEKTLVGVDAQLARAADESLRLSRKGEMIGIERRQAEDERAQLDARYQDGQESLGRLEIEQRTAEEALAEAQRRLSRARAEVDELNSRAAEARAAHAGLFERAVALEAEVARLEEGARELEERIASRAGEREDVHRRREALLQSIADATDSLDAAIAQLTGQRELLRVADEGASALRVLVEGQDTVIRQARLMLDSVRQEAGDLEIRRATGESDLAHLKQSCMDVVQNTLDEVMVEVDELERSGFTATASAVVVMEEPDTEADDLEGTPVDAAAVEATTLSASGPLPSMTAEEAITRLKGKIDRLGPVNMMAIEQYDELETRHAFLTTQRKDLVDSIAQTAEAITRIDETSKVRFREAFAAIQANFAVTFSTLFGGGRAGLTLLDENDPLESGIDIVASPPGKRLQSVQLLSGGEKALTAIALMFAIFRYKPSPFCLLDEIDAPLDDANVGRFVEMLRSMLDRTQFILITHNRRTMEIANRLYGVTMEEPGVSKLISVQLH
ncbi:MAG: chromosome segregation protein SMC [Vicinamibacterales bacterium]